MSRLLYIPTTVTVDGTDLATWGFVADDIPRARDAVDRDLPSVALPGIAGAALTDTIAVPAVREFTITGSLVASSASGLRDAKAKLRAHCGGLPTDGHTIVLVDDASRRIRAQLRGITFTTVETPMAARGERCELRWLALDPYWEDVSTTTVALSTTPASLTLGDAECWPVITVDQSCTVTYTTPGGTTVATITITGVAGGQTAAIDMRARTITHSVSGVTPSLRTAGRFFPFDPQDGAYATSSWPKAVLSSGTGSAVYRKAWGG